MKQEKPEIKKEQVSLSKEEKKRRKGNRSFLASVPYPVKALLIKYWFFGLNYFLFQMGLGSLFAQLTDKNTLYLRIISSFALGVFNDFLVYPILDTIQIYDKEGRYYWMCRGKHIYSFFVNVVYGFLVGFLSWLICLKLYLLIASYFPYTYFFREPFSFALVRFLVDGFFLFIKNLIVYLVKGKETK